MNRVLKVSALFLVLAALVAACQPTPTATPTPQVFVTVVKEQVVVEVTPTPGPVEGTILVDGSSTVAPITMAIAEEFQKQYPEVRVPVGISGTGGGFKKFCPGETDIQNASRPIKKSEIEACAKNNVEYIELPVAFDGIAVVVNPANDFVTCLTVEELKKMWEPDAEGKVTSWAQIRAGFPDRPLSLYGPGVDSGTFEYFTEAIVGKAKASRGDFLASEDDNVLVQGVAGDVGALGYFGLAYYEENKDKLKLVAIDAGDGKCVYPTQETVANGTYRPLARPLFIYVNRARADQKDEIDLFVRFYLENAKKIVPEVGYIPLTDELYSLALRRYEKRITGSVFKGEAQVGVTLADLLKAEQ